MPRTAECSNVPHPSFDFPGVGIAFVEGGGGVQRIRCAVVPAIAVAASALGAVAATLKLRDGSHPAPDVILSSAAGVLFLAAGVFADRRAPANRSGLLMVLVGLALFAEDLQLARSSVVFTAGLVLAHASAPLIAHLVLAFPDGRVTGRPAKALVAAVYVTAFVVSGLGTPFVDWAGRYPGKPENLLLIADLRAVSDVVVQAFDLSSLLISVAVLVVLVVRVTTGAPSSRQAALPVLVVALAGAASTAVASGLGSAHPGYPVAVTCGRIVFCLWPLAFLAGVLRFSPRAARITDLLVALREPCTAAELRDLLARALHDPSLRLGEWDPKTHRFHDEEGELVTPAPGERTVILSGHDGHPVAAIMRRDTTWDDPRVIRAAGRIAGLIAGNRQLGARVRAQAAESRRSRVRLVELADIERQRVERDLHDGAQQHLVTVAIGLRLAQQQLDGRVEPELAAVLDSSARGLETAIAELRELARGIHPAVLTQEGLGPAVAALVDRTPMRITSAAAGLPRFPGPVEATAYFVVAEAVTNALRHACATTVHIGLSAGDGRLVVTVSDDGVGYDVSADGTGLRGLSERVSALDGELTVRSETGTGTAVRAEIPVAEVAQPW